MHHAGTAVWVADPEATWIKGVVKEVDGSGLLVVSTAAGDRRVSAQEAPVQNQDGEVVDVGHTAAG